MTVLSFERFTTAPDADEAFAARADVHLEAVRRAPGALWAELTALRGGYTVLSEWRTGADLDAWEAGDAAVAFARDVDVFLVGEPTRRRFSSAT